MNLKRFHADGPQKEKHSTASRVALPPPLLTRYGQPVRKATANRELPRTSQRAHHLITNATSAKSPRKEFYTKLGLSSVATRTISERKRFPCLTSCSLRRS